MPLAYELVRERPSSNAGLALSRLAPALQRDQWTEHVRRVVAVATPPAYAQHFERVRARTAAGPAWRRVFLAKAQAPVACGMGERTPGENGLTLHPVYGVPYLPGTSLKGILRAWVLGQDWGDDWRPDGSAFDALFGAGGAEGAAASVDILDALAFPREPMLDMDVLTPHVAKYYQGTEDPKGWDGPNPVLFLVARADLEFRVVVEGPEPWVEKAAEWLMLALTERGVGAKTRAGYGRFSCAPLSAENADERRAADRTRRARETPRERLLTELRARPDAARVEIEKWLLGEPVAPSMPAAMREPATDGTRAAITTLVSEWKLYPAWKARLADEQKRQRAQRLLSAWDERFGAPAPEPVAPIVTTAPPPATVGSGFGKAPWAPPVVPPGADAKVCQKEAQRLADVARSPAAPTADGINAALAWLEAHGAKPGQLNQVRRAYKLP